MFRGLSINCSKLWIVFCLKTCSDNRCLSTRNIIIFSNSYKEDIQVSHINMESFNLSAVSFLISEINERLRAFFPILIFSRIKLVLSYLDSFYSNVYSIFLSAPECKTLFDSFENVTYSRLIWQVLKPMTVGYINYTPDNSATRTIIAQVYMRYVIFRD